MSKKSESKRDHPYSTRSSANSAAENTRQELLGNVEVKYWKPGDDIKLSENIGTTRILAINDESFEPLVNMCKREALNDETDAKMDKALMNSIYEQNLEPKMATLLQYNKIISDNVNNQYFDLDNKEGENPYEADDIYIKAKIAESSTYIDEVFMKKDKSLYTMPAKQFNYSKNINTLLAYTIPKSLLTFKQLIFKKTDSGNKDINNRALRYDFIKYNKLLYKNYLSYKFPVNYAIPGNRESILRMNKLIFFIIKILGHVWMHIIETRRIDIYSIDIIKFLESRIIVDITEHIMFKIIRTSGEYKTLPNLSIYPVNVDYDIVEVDNAFYLTGLKVHDVHLKNIKYTSFYDSLIKGISLYMNFLKYNLLIFDIEGVKYPYTYYYKPDNEKMAILRKIHQEVMIKVASENHNKNVIIESAKIIEDAIDKNTDLDADAKQRNIAKVRERTNNNIAEIEYDRERRKIEIIDKFVKYQEETVSIVNNLNNAVSTIQNKLEGRGETTNAFVNNYLDTNVTRLLYLISFLFFKSYCINITEKDRMINKLYDNGFSFEVPTSGDYFDSLYSDRYKRTVDDTALIALLKNDYEQQNFDMEPEAELKRPYEIALKFELDKVRENANILAANFINGGGINLKDFASKSKNAILKVKNNLEKKMEKIKLNVLKNKDKIVELLNEFKQSKKISLKNKIEYLKTKIKDMNDELKIIKGQYANTVIEIKKMLSNAKKYTVSSINNNVKGGNYKSLTDEDFTNKIVSDIEKNLKKY